MEVVIVADQRAGACLVVDAISALLSRRPDAVLGLATGSSPEPVYDEWARRVTDSPGQWDLRSLRCFLLDEYVGLPAGHPARYRTVVQRQVVDRLGLDPDRVHGPDGTGSTAVELRTSCERYEADLAAAGGVDLQLLGIGTDGHIGFNEPGSSLGSRTRIKTLTEATRIDNARFFGGDIDQVPHHVLTQGAGTISAARHLVLLAWGAAKADAVARCVEGPVTAMVPASVLQLHPHVTVVLDEAAAGNLSLADYYRSTFAAKPIDQSL